MVSSLTCGEVAAGVRDRLLAVEHGVRLHLVGRTRGQVTQAVLELALLDGDRLVRDKVVRHAEDFQLERRKVALRRRAPAHGGTLAGPDRHRHVRGRVRRGRYRHRPRQPVVVRRVGVVQPEVVPGAGQPVRELNLVADVPGRDRRVRRRVTHRRVVIEPVVRVIGAEVSRDFYHKVRASTHLEMGKK